MHSFKTLSLFFSLLFIGKNVFSQDAIIKINHDTLFATVKEVGVNEIIYLLPELPQGPTFKIFKSGVEKIIFSTGVEVIMIKDNYKTNGSDTLQNIVAFDLLGLSQSNVTCWYERRIKSGWLGIKIPISFGWDSNNYNYDYLFQSGVQFKAFFNKKSLVRGYFGPEIMAGIVRSEESYYDDISQNWNSHTDKKGYIGLIPIVGFCVQPVKRFYMDFECGAGIARKFNSGGDFYDKRLIPWRASMSLGVKF